MPSLRRTVSSPAVRSSPYSGSATRPGHGHRRSSGSETATRRVLADIEWWRVTEGQLDPEVEQEVHEQSLQSPVENLMDSFEGLVSPVWPGFSELLPGLLTVIPQTPPRRGHRLESSSSVESTPEPSHGPIEGLRIGLQYIDLSSDVSLPPAHANEQASSTASPPPRSRSFMNSSTMTHSEFPSDYPDFEVSPLSSQFPEFSN